MSNQINLHAQTPLCEVVKYLNQEINSFFGENLVYQPPFGECLLSIPNVTKIVYQYPVLLGGFKDGGSFIYDYQANQLFIVKKGKVFVINFNDRYPVFEYKTVDEVVVKP